MIQSRMDAPMPIQHVNRRRQTYYLHEGRTKTGRPNYFFSMKREGSTVEKIREGYEIYENPNAQVFLRKIQSQIISDKEKAVIDKYINKLKNGRSYIVDVKGKTITIHESQQTNHFIDDLLHDFPLVKRLDAIEMSQRAGYYQPIIRFIIDDVENRVFRIERYCFRGSIDDWLFLDTSNNLELLAKKYIKHLGSESFYDLH
jgi:hypothetical protein